MKTIIGVLFPLMIFNLVYSETFPDALSQASRSFNKVQSMAGPVNPAFKNKKILVVYYGGYNTKRVAEDLSLLMGGKVVRIMDLKTNWTQAEAGRVSTFGGQTKIAPLGVNLNDYDIIVAGTVIWAWNMSPAMRTFLVQNKSVLQNKDLAFFTVAGGTAPDKTVRKMAKILKKTPLAFAGWNDAEMNDNAWTAYQKIAHDFVTHLAAGLQPK